ncbi:hypothetical protein FSP39_001793 [Pinctada imbricata]|uniref:Integrase catalytic domain-containing protein n=1 Tax=Pinctada imbricata TaxID=66713 RepID=A0AA88XCQ8_PINIB|nr:hypothetical protein FSP39_011991 [Pinctada imbricata]KAK3085340.1 hypothetical protein FSP39_001793 [Pinctada imbricata]
MSDLSQYLNSIYYNSKHPAAFSGEDKLYRIVQKEGKFKVRKRDVRKWLQEQESFSVHKQFRGKIQRRQVISTYLDYQWDADTAVLESYKSDNDKYAYFLLAIDIFSRYVWTAPLKSRKGCEMRKVLDTIFNSSGRKPHKLRTDKGTEFLNSNVKNLISSLNIDHFVTQNNVKASYAERAIKTIKKKIVRLMTYRQSHRWIDDLQAITASYNATYHRGIGMSPEQVTNKDRYDFWQNQRSTSRPTPPLFFKFKVGDIVRVSYQKNIFSREYDERWSRELFIISSRFIKDNYALYTIKDYNNEAILGTFYSSELQRVIINNDTVYKIEKIVRKRVKNNVSEVLVKWLGYSSKFNSWIPQSSVQEV